MSDKLLHMGVWRDIFGWKALFRWDVIGAIVPGLFVACAIGFSSLDWFPYNLLIAQICFGIAALLFIVKIVGHALETAGSSTGRIIFVVVMCSLVASITLPSLLIFQKHKNRKSAIEPSQEQLQTPPRSEQAPTTTTIPPAGFVTFLGQVIDGEAPVMEVNQTDAPLDNVRLSVTQSLPKGDSESDPSQVGWQKQIEIGTCRAKLSVGLKDKFPIRGQQRIRFDIFILSRLQTYREVINLTKENDKQYRAELIFFDGAETKPLYRQTMDLGIVNDAPRSRTPHEVKLIFKESPLFTEHRKQFLSEQVNAFHDYLARIGYEFPKDCPPIGVLKTNSWSIGFAEPGSIYDAKLNISESRIDDPSQIRGAYAQYVFQKMFPWGPAPDSEFNTRASWIYQRYYLASFSGKFFPEENSSDKYWLSGLWDIRAKYGKDFADKLLFYALQRWSAAEQRDTFDRFFAVRIGLGLDVFENRPGEYEKPIFEIFVKNGLPPNFLDKK